MSLFKKISLWVLGVLVFSFIILVAVRTVHFFNLDKTNAEVEKIHATKLALNDVMGKNLPPDPGAEADKTVQGIDANQNGIRDDVELAIFKEYPNSAKTRAVLLQYALVLQMQSTQKTLNEEITTQIAEENSRTHTCVADTLVPRETPESSRSYEQMEKINLYIKFVENLQFNTEEKKKANEDFYKKLSNFAALKSDQPCDIDLSSS